LDRQTGLIRQLLQFHLPQAPTIAITAAAIGRDEQTPRVTLETPAFRPPPAPDGSHGERTGVVIGADVHKPSVATEIVNPIGVGPRNGRLGKIMSIDLHRGPRFMPRLAFVLVVAEEFLLLGIHGDHGTVGS